MWLFWIAPKGFIPSEDRNFFICFTMGADDISYSEMARKQNALNRLVIEDPDIDNLVSVSATPNNNAGFLFLRLTEGKERSRHIDRVIDELRGPLNAIPGLLVFPMNPPPIEIGGKQSNALYQFVLQADDLHLLYRHVKEFEGRMKGLPGLTDVSSDMNFRSLKMEIAIDRDRAAACGLTAEQIENVLTYGFSGGRVSVIYAPTTQYDVILELEEAFTAYPDILSLLHVKSATGRLVPLASVATVRQTLGPLAVNHQGQRPAATISFNMKPGHSIGGAVDDIMALARKTLPASITTSFEGAAQAFQSSFANLGFLLLITVVVIYMVLGVLYESYLHPVTILSALPLAGFGALLALRIFSMEVDLYAYVGIIMLVGLVKKNGIMMVDFALEAEKAEKKGAVASIHQACMVRFRPIMMTTMAALLGTLPIALGLGAGGESRQPLGVALWAGFFLAVFDNVYYPRLLHLYRSIGAMGPKEGRRGAGGKINKKQQAARGNGSGGWKGVGKGLVRGFCFVVRGVAGGRLYAPGRGTPSDAGEGGPRAGGRGGQGVRPYRGDQDPGEPGGSDPSGGGHQRGKLCGQPLCLRLQRLSASRPGHGHCQGRFGGSDDSRQRVHQRGKTGAVRQQGRERGHPGQDAIPFRAVATNIETGERLVFGQGNTGMAIRASCSVPGFSSRRDSEARPMSTGGSWTPWPWMWPGYGPTWSSPWTSPAG